MIGARVRHALLTDLVIDNAILLVFREIAYVGLRGGDALPILPQCRIDKQLRKTLIDSSRIFLFKHPGVLTGRAGLVFGIRIGPVICNLVDEEERQHLNALREELTLLVEVSLDRLTDLNATKLLLRDVSDDLSLHK